MAKLRNSRRGHTHFVVHTPSGHYVVETKGRRSWRSIYRIYEEHNDNWIVKTGKFIDCLEYTKRTLTEKIELCRWNLRMIRQQEKIISTKG